MNYICRHEPPFPCSGALFHHDESSFSLSLVYTVPEGIVIDDEGHDLSVSGESLGPAFAGQRFLVEGPLTVSMEELRARQEWKDRSVWSVLLQNNGLHAVPVGIMNKDAESMPMRRSPGITSRVYGTPILFDMLVPFADADFDDISFIFYVGQDFILASNAVFEEVSMEEAMALRDTLLPTLTMDGPTNVSAGGTATLSISSFWKGAPCSRPLTVELESVNGYLPKTRLVFTGQTTFPVMALGLVAGDSMRIKAGFRYRASVDEKTLEVVD